MNLTRKRNGLSGLETGFPQLIDFEHFFDSPFLRNEASPAVNVKETEKNFEVELAAPGLTKKDFLINTEGGRLNISYHKEEEKKEELENYQYQEFSSRSFQRSFMLPEVVDEQKIEAQYVDGILRIILQKNAEMEKENVRKIAIS